MICQKQNGNGPAGRDEWCVTAFGADSSRADRMAVYDFYRRYSASAPEQEPKEGDRPAELQLLDMGPSAAADWFTGADRVGFCAYAGPRLVGFVSGVADESRGVGYLSYLCVAPDCRRRGIGTRLMEAWEQALWAREAITKLDVVFHNPVHLPWLIPGGQGDYHPCLPGVDQAGTLCPFLCGRGFSLYAEQNAYYRRFTDGDEAAEPMSSTAARAQLKAEGIEITLYDPKCHRGLGELFDNIRNPGWKAQVMAHTDRPIVVAVDTRADGLVVAYTGPLTVSRYPAVTGDVPENEAIPSGGLLPKRGNFCGIGTHTAYRGRGIGKLVFAEMCRRHAAAGADFMSLYTGSDNPARFMYEAAGFHVVRRFADLRKRR